MKKTIFLTIFMCIISLSLFSQKTQVPYRVGKWLEKVISEEASSDAELLPVIKDFKDLI